MTRSKTHARGRVVAKTTGVVTACLFGVSAMSCAPDISDEQDTEGEDVAVVWQVLEASHGNGTDEDLDGPHSNGDGDVDAFDKSNASGPDEDTDNDGVKDAVDLDDDNDGLPDALEGNGGIDMDEDGVPDSCDLDSDNDGIADSTEAGHDLQATGGVVDCTSGVGDNGLCDDLETRPDSGVPDYDRDGAMDGAVDSDGAGTPDFRDTDSDNDGVPDVAEGDSDCTNTDPVDAICDGADTDGDGVVDSIDDTSGFGADDDFSDPTPDTDRDGTQDFRDPDDDNDGIQTRFETGDAAFPNLRDTDDDNQPDYLDPDDDNDGSLTSVDGADPDGDGDPRDAFDLDNDGIPDFLDEDVQAQDPGVAGGSFGCSANSAPSPGTGVSFVLLLLGVHALRLRGRSRRDRLERKP